jgi:small subunit ribosomal protein S6
MNKYEAMFIVKPDLSEEEKKELFGQINDAITKNGGIVSQSGQWSEKRKMCFPIKKQLDGVYYLVNFDIKPEVITKLREIFKLNEGIIRLLITVL